MSSTGDRLVHIFDIRKIPKAYALAVEIGVDESCISRWRKGGSISIKNAIELCRALDVSLDWLLTGRGHVDQHRDLTVSRHEYGVIQQLRTHIDMDRSHTDVLGFVVREDPSAAANRHSQKREII